jgi:hypothetical protein
MSGEAALQGLPREVRIHGVNGIGHEVGNDAACVGHTTPWLQDTPAESVWSSWSVTYRDVVILDDANLPVAVYNLTVYDLGVPAHYDALLALLVGAASAP